MRCHRAEGGSGKVTWETVGDRRAAVHELEGLGADPLCHEKVGRHFMDVVSAKDRVLVDQLLRMAAKKGRIDNVRVKLKTTKGLTGPLGFAGYVMPDLRD